MSLFEYLWGSAFQIGQTRPVKDVSDAKEAVALAFKYDSRHGDMPGSGQRRSRPRGHKEAMGLCQMVFSLVLTRGEGSGCRIPPVPLLSNPGKAWKCSHSPSLISSV